MSLYSKNIANLPKHLVKMGDTTGVVLQNGNSTGSNKTRGWVRTTTFTGVGGVTRNKTDVLAAMVSNDLDVTP